jgi:chromatin assembly factor 1 subunit B
VLHSQFINLRFRFCTIKCTFKIRWHHNKFLSSYDFEFRPVSNKNVPGMKKTYTIQAYILAPGGEDNYVRVSAKDSIVGQYLATLSPHSATANVFSFAPNGRSLAFIHIVDPP